MAISEETRPSGNFHSIWVEGRPLYGLMTFGVEAQVLGGVLPQIPGAVDELRRSPSRWSRRRASGCRERSGTSRCSSRSRARTPRAGGPSAAASTCSCMVRGQLLVLPLPAVGEVEEELLPGLRVDRLRVPQPVGRVRLRRSRPRPAGASILSRTAPSTLKGRGENVRHPCSYRPTSYESGGLPLAPDTHVRDASAVPAAHPHRRPVPCSEPSYSRRSSFCSPHRQRQPPRPTAPRSSAIRPSRSGRSCKVFGPYGQQALAVAWCESRWYKWASNGQYLGLFQMGSFARARYGHSTSNAWVQVRAAYRYFVELGRDWSPWSCQP